MPFEKFVPLRTGERFDNGKPMLRFAKNGVISLNRLAYRMLKEPECVLIHLDLDAGLLGLQAVDAGHPDCVRLRVEKSGGAKVSVKSLYRAVADRYTSPVKAEARYHTDTILAARVLPPPAAKPTSQEVNHGSA